MSALFKDATNDAVQFLTKHGDLTRAAAYDAIRLLTGNGFVVTQTDMLPSATDLSQAAVAAALEAARREALRLAYDGDHSVANAIRAQITQPQHDALAAHVAAEVAKARADQARDAALVEAAGTLEDQALDAEAQAKRFRGGSDPWADRTARSRALRNSADTILALRDKPAPGVTVQEAAKVLLGTMKTDRAAFDAMVEQAELTHGAGASFNKVIGNALRAIAGGGDE